MKSILSLAFLLTILGTNAQNNLVVFSENGEKFFLIINGVKQNLEAETNVKVTELIHSNYKAKIEFEDKSKGVLDKNIYLMDGGEPVKNHEFVYSVGVSKKGYKVRPISVTSIADTKPSANQSVVHYTTSEPTAAKNNVVNQGASSSNAIHVADDGTTESVNSNIQVNQTVTETKTEMNVGNGSNTKVDVNMNGLGVNVNISDNMGDMGSHATTTTSQTVTTTSSSSSNGNLTSSSSTVKSSKTSGGSTKSSGTTSSMNTKSSVEGNALNTNVTSGCSTPMSSNDFETAKESVNTAGIDDTKLKIAKQIIDSNCMSTDQIKDMMELLSFDKARLDLAKHGYSRVTDKNNYYKVNDALSFESSKSELDSYISSTKKATTK